MHLPKTKQIGVVAQDVEKAFPELVYTDENGYKFVDYEKLSAVLIEVANEQQKKIDDLQNQINNIYSILNK